MEFFAQAAGRSGASSNPYVYKSGTPSNIFIALCVCEFLLKVVFCILLMTMDDFADCSSSCWILLGSITFSFYFMLFVYTNDDLTITQRYGPLKLFIQPVVYLAALNVLSKLYVAYTLSKCVAPHGTTAPTIDVTRLSGWMLVLIAATAAIDVTLVWIGTQYDVQTYDVRIDGLSLTDFQPNKGSFLFKKTRTFEERDGPLSIIESGSFRIILQNLSPEPFNEKKVEVKRKVGSVKKTDPTGSSDSESYSTVVRFTIKLDQPINPGHMVTVIPETHNELGAIKVPGYRAFAPQVSEVVKTRIRAGKKVLSRLTETYARIVEMESTPMLVPTGNGGKKEERQPVVSFAK